MKVIDIICRTRDAVMQLELSDKTKTNYIYCGLGAILNFFISRGEESYSPETLALFEKTVQENFVNGAMQKASFSDDAQSCPLDRGISLDRTGVSAEVKKI